MIVLCCLEHLGATKLGFNAFITAPGRCRKVETTKKSNSVNFAGRNSAMVKRCDQKTKQLNESWINKYYSLSVYICTEHMNIK